MTDTKKVPLHILQAAAGVLESQLQTLEHCCVDWAKPDMNRWLSQNRDLLDWLIANGIPVTEYACSNHQSLFDQYLGGRGNG